MGRIVTSVIFVLLLCCLAAPVFSDSSKNATQLENPDILIQTDITLDNGDQYVGEVNEEGLPHGHGTYIWAENYLYKGGFRDGRKHGLGTLSYINGPQYVGNWENDVRSGEGKEFYAGHGHYSGDWKNNVRTGQGVMIYPGGGYYIGEWKGDKKHGLGKEFSVGSMNTLEGSFVNGELQGNVRAYLTSSQTKITATFENGSLVELLTPTGLSQRKKTKLAEQVAAVAQEVSRKQKLTDTAIAGRIDLTIDSGLSVKFFASEQKYDNGDRFFGEIIDDGLRDGQGTLIYANGGHYDGGWKNGMKHGKGNEYYADGTRYFGEWQEDVRHGQGSEYNADGTDYSGGWQEGRRHGKGSQTYSNGQIYVGTWNADEWHGKGELIEESFGTFRGNFNHGTMHGEFSLTTPSGNKWLLLFINGQLVDSSSDQQKAVSQQAGLVRQLVEAEAERNRLAAEERKRLEATEAERRRQQQANALIQIGTAIANGQPMFGTPSRSSNGSKTPAGLRTCIYRVGTGEVSHTVAAGQICPNSMMFGNRRGYFKRSE